MFGSQSQHQGSNWIRIYDDLRSRIKSGSLRAESGVNADELGFPASAELDIALRRLADEGLLALDANNQLKVSKPRARSRRSASFQADYAKQGRKPTTRTLSLELVPVEQAPAFVQHSLQNQPLSMNLLLRHHHVQSVDNVPHAIADSYIPFELINSRYALIQAGDHDIFQHLEALGHQVSHKDETLYVDVPTLEEREHLDIVSMPNVQVVRLDCVVFAGEQLVEVCLLTDRADLYEFSYHIRV